MKTEKEIRDEINKLKKFWGMKTFKQFFLEFLSKEENNLSETTEYRKHIGRFSDKLAKEYQKGDVEE